MNTLQFQPIISQQIGGGINTNVVPRLPIISQPIGGGLNPNTASTQYGPMGVGVNPNIASNVTYQPNTYQTGYIPPNSQQNLGIKSVKTQYCNNIVTILL